jgi:hypothetical protein
MNPNDTQCNHTHTHHTIIATGSSVSNLKAMFEKNIQKQEENKTQALKRTTTTTVKKDTT